MGANARSCMLHDGGFSSAMNTGSMKAVSTKISLINAGVSMLVASVLEGIEVLDQLSIAVRITAVGPQKQTDDGIEL